MAVSSDDDAQGTDADSNKTEENPNDVAAEPSIVTEDADTVTERARIKREVEVVAERASVKLEIEAVIEPYCHSTERPPFTVAEMAVMAILCSYERSLSRNKIHEWAIRTFRFYTDQAISRFVACGNGDTCGGNDWPDTSLLPDFSQVYDDWTVPLFHAQSRLPVLQDRNRSAGVPVAVGPGRVFLSSWLEPKRNGTFPFFELPPELRNVIYEMVLRFPRSGLAVLHACPESKDPNFCALERREATISPPRSWNVEPLTCTKWIDDRHTTGQNYLQCGTLSDVLAMLCVNKQTYAEALPIFYRDNAFYTFDLDSTINLLHELPSSRAQHLSDLTVHLSYGPGNGHCDNLEYFPAAMTKLSEAKKFKRLRVRADDKWWLELDKSHRMELGRTDRHSRIKHFREIPGMMELAQAASKADGLVFLGHCSKLEEYVRGVIKSLKEGDQLPKKEDKRAEGRTTHCVEEVVDEGENV